MKNTTSRILEFIAKTRMATPSEALDELERAVTNMDVGILTRTYKDDDSPFQTEVQRYLRKDLSDEDMWEGVLGF